MGASSTDAAVTALKLAWDGNLPVSPAKIANRLNIKRTLADGSTRNYPIQVIGKTSVELEGASGRASFDDSGDNPVFTCEYNIDEVAYRARFTIAHELGHVVLGHVTKSHHPMRDTSFKANSFEPEEIEANNFAAELLMPADLVKSLYESMPSLSSIAQAFNVSEAAMMYRLKNLGLYT